MIAIRLDRCLTLALRTKGMAKVTGVSDVSSLTMLTEHSDSNLAVAVMNASRDLNG